MLKSVVGPVLRPVVRSIFDGFGTFAFSPASFFASGEQGWWYAVLSNFATLFQDSVGTTPVTAVEQPVGLQLDLSKGLVLGPELVTNGDFSNGTTGWTASSVVATVSDGVLTLSGGTGTFSQAFTTIVGKVYKVTGNILQVGTVFTGIRKADDAGATTNVVTIASTVGAAQGIFTATATTTYLVLQQNFSATSGKFDNVTVKELPGNHRFQTTSANRPVVSARVNLLTKTEEFDAAVWLKQRVSIGGTTVTPVGTMQGLVEDGTTNSHRIVVNGVTVPASTNQTFSCYAKANTRNFAYLSIQSGSANEYVTVVYDLVNGTASASSVGSSLGTLVSSSATSVGGGVYRLSFVYSLGTKTFIYPVIGLSDSATPTIGSNGDLSYAGNGTSGAFILGADLRPTNQGVGLPVYQRVNTSTDYDSTGFPVYIKPNGSNQFMVTNSINFSATDKMTVWQGVRKLSDAATGCVAEISVNAAVNAGAFAITAPEGAASNYGFFLRGDTGYPGYSATTFAAPVTNVLSVAYDISGAAIADEIKPRINGATPTLGISAAGPAGGGNFGTYPAYFYMRAGSSLPFGGNDYGSIARGAASTAAQITAGETYIDSLTKAFA